MSDHINDEIDTSKEIEKMKENRRRTRNKRLNNSGEESDLLHKGMTDDDKEPIKIGILHEIRDWVMIIAFALVMALILGNFVVANAQVPTGSMENTIMTGDRIMGLRLSYLFSEPERGDVVIFKYPDDESVLYIKRIIGMPGETLEIAGGKVYINGSETPLNEPYLKETPYAINYGPVTIPEGCYFMMGDNRNDSKDSRYWNNTFLAREKIVAKALFRYYPKPSWIE